jgi:hypothetical protein
MTRVRVAVPAKCDARRAHATAELMVLDGVEPPFSRDAFEFLVSTVVKLDAGARYEVFHGSRDENFSGLGERSDSRATMA